MPDETLGCCRGKGLRRYPFQLPRSARYVRALIMGDGMRRRDLVKAIAGAAAWPFAALAQDSGRAPLIGWLDGQDESDPLSRSVRVALRQGLAEHGWIEGRNLRIEWRFGAGDASRMEALARELVSLSPRVI